MSYVKKTALFFIFIFTFSLMTIPAYASGTDLRSGIAPTGAMASIGSTATSQTGLSSVKSVRYSASGGIETVTINIERYGDVHTFYLAEPGRFVIDIASAVLPAGRHSLDIGKGSVQRVRFSMFDELTSRFVIDLLTGAEFTVKTGKGFIKAEAVTGVGDIDPIIIVPQAGGTPVSSTTASQDATVAVDNPDVSYAGDNLPPGDNIKADGSPVDEPSPPPPPDGAESAATRTPRPVRTPRISPSPSPRRLATPRIPALSQTPAPSVDQTVVIPPPIVTKDELSLGIASGLSLKISLKSGMNVCTISMPKGLAEKSKITDANGTGTVSVEIPYAAPGGILGAKSAPVNSDVLKSVSISQSDASAIRIVFDIRDRVSVESSADNDKIIIYLSNKLIANVGYHKNEERAFVTLYQTALTSGSETLNTFYDSYTEDGGKTWTISFESERGLLDEGAATIDDNLLKTIGIYKKGSKTFLTIAAKDSVRLVIYAKQVADVNLLETTISILRPAAASEQLVVIDAGHGGYDPGAVGLSGRNEKEFNLDIAIKLKERLTQEHGFRVYLTRDDDYFVDLYERAELANALNATLFVSIHANASDINPEANGIETLYFPSDADIVTDVFTSYNFAEMMQKKLVARLQTTDRGIVQRPNLVVLRKTNMPAILVETAFVTNKNDLLNLSRSAFRKSIANAIGESIIEALKYGL